MNALDEFLEKISAVTKADFRLRGLLVGGSHVSQTTDIYSDLDCILIACDSEYSAVLADRRSIAERVGKLLHSFTGEFLGEPRLLICLYQQPLIHVDYKVLTTEMLIPRVEDPIIVWERDGSIHRFLASTTALWTKESLEWFEEHFWIWLHNAATKVGRGELFQALDMFALLRKRIFGPLLAEQAGNRQHEVRHIEKLGLEAVRVLVDLSPLPEQVACTKSLYCFIDIYLQLTNDKVPANRIPESEQIIRQYIQQSVG